MLTGTPLDLTSFGVILNGIGLLYWLFVIGALAFVLIKIKGPIFKTLSAALVLFVLVGPLVSRVLELKEREKIYKDKLAAATQIFNEHCKTAGEKITKKINDVDGVLWMKWRKGITGKEDRQFELNDPYGRDCWDEDCIRYLLRETNSLGKWPQEAEKHTKGFRFVDSRDPRDGRLYRYTGRMSDVEFELQKTEIMESDAHYGVIWDDISTREDREKWIAGSSLKVIDLQTKEVLAERIGYMMDSLQGSTAHFREPWGYAVQNACPKFSQLSETDPRRIRNYLETPNFVFKTLIPTEEK